MPEQIDRAQWLRLLQVSDDSAPMQTLASQMQPLAAQMETAQARLLAAARPRGVYRVLPFEELEYTALDGFSIRKHLEGCDQVAVLAVTTGAGIDQLLTRTQVTDISLAVVMDAGASVLTEQVTDSAEKSMKEELARKLPEIFTTSRFSPGYGDYPIQFQREILRLADAGRRIGLTVTAGDMMVPHKSITALVGLADHPVSGRLASCGECVLREKCTLRRAGQHC